MPVKWRGFSESHHGSPRRIQQTRQERGNPTGRQRFRSSSAINRDALTLRQSLAMAWLGRWIGFTLSVGFVEELMKAHPVVWVAYWLEPASRLATSMSLDTLSGLAFGATEGPRVATPRLTLGNGFRPPSFRSRLSRTLLG